MSRITLEMNGIEVLITMAEGNPGALTALRALLQTNSQVDPDSFMGPLSSILSLDRHEIYGSDIWVLFKDICNEDARNTHSVLRAVQLGIIDIEELKSAMKRTASIEVDGILKQVQKRLPRFGQNE